MAAPYVHRTLADGCAELVFHYKGRFDEITAQHKTATSFVAGLHGQSKNFRRFIVHEDFGIFGVYLYRYAIPALFSIPSDEVSDQMPDLQTLLGNEGKDLEDKMMNADSHLERASIVSVFFSKRLLREFKTEPGVFMAIQHVIENRGMTPVRDLAAQSCLSTRQFERKFKAFSGFSPKLYSRISRFQATLRAYTNQDKSLTEIACESGYYDQSHFIHDFKTFSGHPPHFYFSGRGEDTAYLDA
jgi:AraC-like DNA-binding protein